MPGPPVVGGGVVGPVVGGGVVPPGSVHFWLAVPAQVQICSWLPLAELLSVASRHLPEPVLTSVPLAAVHFWALVPLQSYSWTLAPSAVEAAVTSMHLPTACRVLSPV